MDKYIAEDMSTFKVKANPQGDTFERAAAEHPYLNYASELAVEIPTIAKTAMPNITSAVEGAGLGAKALAMGTNQLGQIALNAPLAAGMTGGSIKDQDKAATMAAYLTPALNAAGSLIVSGAKKALTVSRIQEVLKPISEELRANGNLSMIDKSAASVTNYANNAKEESNRLYQVIKDIPGTIEAYPAMAQVNKILKQGGAEWDPAKSVWDFTASRFTDPQRTGLQSVLANLQNLNNMDDAIKLKSSLHKTWEDFSGAASEDIYSLFKSLQSTVDDSIGKKAVDAGVPKAWQEVKNFYKDTMIPLYTMKAFDIADATANMATNKGAYNLATKNWLPNAFKSPQAMEAALKVMDPEGSKIMEQSFLVQNFGKLLSSPDALNKNQALLKVNEFKRQFGPVLSKESNSVIKGLKTILEEGGAQAGAKPYNMPKYINASNVGAAAGAAIGTVLGGGWVGTGVGAAAGSVALPATLNYLHKLMNTSQGIAILKGIGEGKPWAKGFNQVLKTGIPAEYANMTKSDLDE
jgi:hypothetical protein